MMKSLPDLAGFTFVPMLTGTEANGHRKNGAKKDLEQAYRTGKAGAITEKLREHLARLQEIDNDLEYINGISTYFDKEMILIDISGGQRFTNNERISYFRSVFGKFPKNSLIFIDPDTGLKDESPELQTSALFRNKNGLRPDGHRLDPDALPAFSAGKI